MGPCRIVTGGSRRRRAIAGRGRENKAHLPGREAASETRVCRAPRGREFTCP